MIAFTRSAVIAPGKAATAQTYARDIVKLVKDKTGVDVRLAMPVGGNPARIGFLAQYDNLGQLESFQAQLMADSSYLELVSKGADNFVAGSLHDEIWRLL